MVNIVRKEDCVGCGACADICPVKAISLETDIEGFWYPKIDLDRCTNCGLCETTCPELHIQEVKQACVQKEPNYLAAMSNDGEIRRKSTSGGVFSVLADKTFDDGGYVCGAVYNEGFDVRHIISNNREDLERIRGSKHCQSDMQGVFRQVKKLLDGGEAVLICAAPCQIAGLRLFLKKDYEKLTTVDFICLGINSNKILHKHMASLEHRFGGKVVSVQGKNKDNGWRSLAYKIKFSNGKVYLRNGKEDDFTRGFIFEHINCRPACYECKYKGFPRISDITLGDFWGIEKIDKTMDDNLGTSVVMLNSQKGIEFFDSVKDKFRARETTLEDALPGNQAILYSIPKPKINRDEFYKDLDRLDFDDVVKKYYSNGSQSKFSKATSFIGQRLSQMGLRPKAYIQLVWINVLRKNSQCRVSKAKLIFPAKYSVIHLHKSARVCIKGLMVFGYKRIKGSKLETRLAVEKNGSFTVESGSVQISYGTDILVFEGANLTFKGSASINQNAQIICMDSITIGSDVMISRDVVIRDNDGGHEVMAEGYKKTDPVVIGNHVWIGHGAMIMKGVTIGDGAIISAGAWVANNVKAHSLVMGDPARTVRKDIEWRI